MSIYLLHKHSFNETLYIKWYDHYHQVLTNMYSIFERQMSHCLASSVYLPFDNFAKLIYTHSSKDLVPV